VRKFRKKLTPFLLLLLIITIIIFLCFFWNWFPLCFPTHNGYIFILLLLILLYRLGYHYVYGHRHPRCYYILNINSLLCYIYVPVLKRSFRLQINERNYIINVNWIKITTCFLQLPFCQFSHFRLKSPTQLLPESLSKALIPRLSSDTSENSVRNTAWHYGSLHKHSSAIK
jgi:hypothetical protein